MQGPIPVISSTGAIQDPISPQLPFGTSVPAGYSEQEFFVSGTANVFNFNSQPANPGPAPGSNLIVQIPHAPYKTRVIVVAPAAGGPAFSGDVAVEFFNSTGQEDADATFQLSGSFFARKGWIYVGVTTSATESLNFLKNSGCCGTRYASLTLADNGQEYEIVSQVVTALKNGSLNLALGPSVGAPNPVDRVYVVGESQQGGSVITHANQFSFPLVNGYIVISNDHARTIGGSGAPGDPNVINECGTANAPAYPACYAQLPVGQDLIRTNLPMPVYHLMTEEDTNADPRNSGVATFFSGDLFRQADADTPPNGSYRLVEIAGTAHITNINLKLIPPVFTNGDACVNPAFGFSGPIAGNQIVDAMMWNMFLQTTFGILPPHAQRITTDATGAVVRDTLGNARGGVRMPEFAFPTNSYFLDLNLPKPTCTAGSGLTFPQCLPPQFAPFAPLLCATTGSLMPLSAAQIHALYPNHGAYVSDIAYRASTLAFQRFLLPEDAAAHVEAAINSTIGN